MITIQKSSIHQKSGDFRKEPISWQILINVYIVLTVD